AVLLGFDLLLDGLEDPLQVLIRLANAQAHEPQRGALVEDDDEDDALPHDRDVDVVPLPLVEEDRELLLADQASETVGRGDVSSRQGSERSGVERLEIALRGDLLPVLVDDEDVLRLRIGLESTDDVLDLLELLVEKYEVGHAALAGVVYPMRR